MNLKTKYIYIIKYYGRMQDKQVVMLDIPTEPLAKGDISWSEYISSLSPEQLEKQREYDRAKSRKWYEKNKEKKKEKERERREQIKQKKLVEMTETEQEALREKVNDELKIRQQKRSEYLKQYREHNSDHIAQVSKAYRERVKDKQSQKFVCPICGGRYTLRHKTTHERSKKHEDAVKSSADPNTSNSNKEASIFNPNLCPPGHQHESPSLF
jgi:alanyl-tRNA synthetase